MEKKEAFKQFKEVCYQACHDRNACPAGFRKLLASENIYQLMATWRNSWDSIVESKYSDLIRTKLKPFYLIFKYEMNKAGIYLNECPQNAPDFVRVLITDTDRTVKIYDYAQAYVLGNAKVEAYGHSRIYNTKADDAIVILNEYSIGYVRRGHVIARDYTILYCHCQAELNGAVHCMADGGTVTAYSYCNILALGDTKVSSVSSAHISLFDQATLTKIENAK